MKQLDQSIFQRFRCPSFLINQTHLQVFVILPISLCHLPFMMHRVCPMLASPISPIILFQRWLHPLLVRLKKMLSSPFCVFLSTHWIIVEWELTDLPPLQIYSPQYSINLVIRIEPSFVCFIDYSSFHWNREDEATTFC